MSDAPPTFNGLIPGLIPWTLLGFILLSACLHAFGFYIFQTIYPPAAHVGPPPVQVGLLVPGTPEADAILRWIDSEDPALAAQPGRAPIPGLTSLPYTPSYTTVHARPIMAPTPQEAIPYPAGPSGLELIRMAAAHPTASLAPPAPVTTAVSFSGPLKGAALDPLPSFDTLRELSLGDLQPARYLLGVSDHGEVRYVFLQDAEVAGGSFGSGDKTLDAAAARLLEQVHFRPSGDPLTWGFATIHWGSAIYPQPTPEPEASP